MWRRAGRQRAVAGERRRRRRYGADVLTLTSPDFVLTSGAQVAPTCGAVARGLRRASGARASAAVGAMAVLVLRSRSSRCHRLSVERPPVHATAHSNLATLPYKAVAPATPRASPRQRGSSLGRRRSYVVPGPTKPVRPLSTPQRGASSRTCHRPRRPRVPPPTWLSRQRPGAPKGNTNALKSGRYSPRFNAVRTALSQLLAVQAYLAALRRQQRRTKRMAAGEMHTALLEVMQRAPTGSNPLLAYLRKTPPGPTGPARDSDRSQSKEDHPTASARVPSPGNNCCFTPRPASKDDKKHKAILQREINHTALLLTEAAKPSNDVPRNPPPTKPSRPRSADARSLGGTPRRPGAAPSFVGGGPW